MSQNTTAVAPLLHGLLEAATPEDRQAHHEIHTLVEHVAAQQAESSLSRRHKLDASQRTLSMDLVHQCLSHNNDARNTLDACRRAYDDPREGARRGYHPRHGGRYDSGED